MSGIEGSLSGPGAATTTSAVSGPCVVSSRQRPRVLVPVGAGDLAAEADRGRDPERSAQSRR